MKKLTMLGPAQLELDEKAWRLEVSIRLNGILLALDEGQPQPMPVSKLWDQLEFIGTELQRLRQILAVIAIRQAPPLTNVADLVELVKRYPGRELGGEEQP